MDVSVSVIVFAVVSVMNDCRLKVVVTFSVINFVVASVLGERDEKYTEKSVCVKTEVIVTVSVMKTGEA